MYKDRDESFYGMIKMGDSMNRWDMYYYGMNEWI